MSEEKKTNETPASRESQSESQSGPPDLEALQAQLDKAKKDYLYLLADFDNYRKNAIRERSDLTKFGAERLVREFLTVFDNFERALEAEVTGENWPSFRSGVKMIADEIKTLLHKFGVEEVRAEGLAFDPSVHEALSSEPSAAVPPGHVARVFQKAYKMHDKLIRTAQVTVATEPPKPN